MLVEPNCRALPINRFSTDGWLGTPGFPAYRAGNVVVRLDAIPAVYPDHLYLHLILLDARGQFQDSASGPCYALTRVQSADDRSRYVRVVAELMRHAPSEDRGLSGVGQAINVVRERGIEPDRLVLAAQLLDDVSAVGAVVASLKQLLELNLGVEEAPLVLCEVVVKLMGTDSTRAKADDVKKSISGPHDDEATVNEGGLATQLSYIVRTVGKARARRYLRGVIDLLLVPTPEILFI